MRYVGASNLFIQAPFMIEGALAAGGQPSQSAPCSRVCASSSGWMAPFKWTNFIGVGGGNHDADPRLAAVALAIIASALVGQMHERESHVRSLHVVPVGVVRAGALALAFASFIAIGPDVARARGRRP